MLSHIHQPGLDFGHKLQLPSPMVNDWLIKSWVTACLKIWSSLLFFFSSFFLYKTFPKVQQKKLVKLVEFTWEKQKIPKFFVKKWQKLTRKKPTGPHIPMPWWLMKKMRGHSTPLGTPLIPTDNLFVNRDLSKWHCEVKISCTAESLGQFFYQKWPAPTWVSSSGVTVVDLRCLFTTIGYCAARGM